MKKLSREYSQCSGKSMYLREICDQSDFQKPLIWFLISIAAGFASIPPKSKVHKIYSIFIFIFGHCHTSTAPLATSFERAMATIVLNVTGHTYKNCCTLHHDVVTKQIKYDFILYPLCVRLFHIIIMIELISRVGKFVHRNVYICSTECEWHMCAHCSKCHKNTNNVLTSIIIHRQQSSKRIRDEREKDAS